MPLEEVEVRHRTRILAALVLCAATSGVAHAQLGGQYTGATILAPGGHLFGGYLDVSDHVVGLTAQLRLSFYPGVDFGFQGGPARVNSGGSSRGLLRLGTDLRVAAHHAEAAAPFDVALGGQLAVENGDRYSVLSIGPSCVISRGFRATEPGGITPYASMVLLYSSSDIAQHSDTNFSVPLRLGAEFNATPAARIIGEVQYRVSDDLRDRTSFNVGVNLPF
jgi:hypothetical protein